MALTPTRTRNQTTLNKLAKMLAALNGEYAFCLDILDAEDVSAEDGGRLRTHLAALQIKRDALRLTLLQFKPTLDVDSIGELDAWRLRFGKRNVAPKSLQRRLFAELKQAPN